MLLSSGCAAIIDGPTDTLDISATPTAANCALYRQGAMVAWLPHAPARSILWRSDKPIVVACVSPLYALTAAKVEPHLDDWMWLDWAPPALLVDFLLPSRNAYRTHIHINLVPLELTPGQRAQIAHEPVPYPPTSWPPPAQYGYQNGAYKVVPIDDDPPPDAITYRAHAVLTSP
ncbi:hypothetical protein E3E12_02120 [Formicincola oecophyllae]|uniref:Uncharacterized protein n=1 Tax=Formicincola oecophyllae TaxID=2558361 RepID=A0A4Y6U9Z0_9PROT|nr:hypothetical protein [Formicincola oecophyllae]QDH13191.1 hypothetical protein E3E12_02120 [Formicincola oecophyllae]